MPRSDWRITLAIGAVCLVFAAIAGAQSTDGAVPLPRPDNLVPVETPELETATPTPTPSFGAPTTGPETGFPLPRYVSMDATRGYARRGPSRNHRIDWVFQERNMPLMVVAEHGHWRRVVDHDGVGGWMHYALLSGRRTAQIDIDLADLHQRPDPDATVIAQAQRGVVGRVSECERDWCRFAVDGFTGWVEKSALWGVMEDEIFD